MCFKKQTRKILKSMIQKYSLHDPPQEKIYYCVKIIIIILIKIKHQSF